MKLDITNKIYNDEDAARAHIEDQLWPRSRLPSLRFVRRNRAEAKPTARACISATMPRAVLRHGRHRLRALQDPLHKWVLAAHLMGASKKGVSSKQIQRMLGVTYKTAWFMTMRLREAMTDRSASRPHRRHGQGGRERRKFRRRQKEERPQRQARAQEACRACTGGAWRRNARQPRSRRHRQDVARNLVTQARRKSNLMTDEAHAYKGVGKEFAEHARSIISRRICKQGRSGIRTPPKLLCDPQARRNGTFHSISEQHLAALRERVRVPLEQPCALGIEDFERAQLCSKARLASV